MKKLFTLLTAVLLSVAGWSQVEFSIVSPEGLTPPYEVAPGTEVTFQWYYFDEAPTTVFTHNEEPIFPGFGTAPEWTEHTNYTDNGDGTYNITLTIDEPTWVFGGYFASFLMQWTFSEVIPVGIASSVVISYEDGLICGDGTGEEVLSVEGTYESYQWFLNNEPIDGATEATYTATEAGSYKLEVSDAGEMLFSNVLNLTSPVIEIAGEFVQGETDITMTATEGYDTYQWLSGPDADNLTAIDGQTGMSAVIALESETTYYAVEGVVDGCTATSEVRMASLPSFAVPAIIVAADTNEFGNVCDGTTINLSVEDVYESYNWVRDGWNSGYTTAAVSISSTWQTGSYVAEVNPMGWPEITITSEAFDAQYFEVADPQMFLSEQGPYCPDTEVSVILSDEGYEYTWYVHTEWTPTEADIVEVDGTTLTMNFTEQVYVTVVAVNEGCSADNRITLNAAADDTPYISLVNWQEQYLCLDSSSAIQVPSWDVDNYTNIQWFEDIDGTLTEIPGASDAIYDAESVGFYSITANLVACPEVEVASNTVEIRSYLDREIFIYADDADLCVGEVTNLNISGAANWQDLQWFEETITIGQSGYEESFIPMIGAGTEPIQEVTEFSSYIVKGRHVTCPNGLKNESNVVDIRYQVNPTITVDPNYGITSWKPAIAFDSIATYRYCADEPVVLSIPDEYDSYEWYGAIYAGDDDYELGNLEDGANTNVLNAAADAGAEWFTAVVEQDGCVGHSDPVLIDTWVFLAPTITSYGNNEICQEGDSALMHISFPGNYEEIRWLLNGQVIEGATNDSIWGTDEGMYVVEVRREECPGFWLTSGIGPTLSTLEAFIMENDTVIWAMPQLGYYTYQWYLDGEPIDGDEELPWVLYKDEMADGVYTVEVTNNTDCTDLSDEGYIWDTTGLQELYDAKLVIYPNPARNQFQIDGIELDQLKSIRIYDITGKVVATEVITSNTVDISQLMTGIYFAELTFNDNVSVTRKIIKE